MKKIIKKFLSLFNKELRNIDAPTRSLNRGIQVLSERMTVNNVIDIGVADGTSELYRHFPPANHKYLLVEANPDYYTRVNALAQKFNAQKAMVFCGAISGTKQLSIFSDGRKSSAYTPSRKLGINKTLTVPVETLDTLVAKHGLSETYLIKIDVEGAELEVIAGATDTLHHTQAVIAEISVAKKFSNGPEMADIVCSMHQHGFSVYDMVAGVNRGQQLYQVDIIFVRTDAPFR